MTNNAILRHRRARRLIARRNRQLDRIVRLQKAVVHAKQELSRREVAVLAEARRSGLRVRYAEGHWSIP